MRENGLTKRLFKRGGRPLNQFGEHCGFESPSCYQFSMPKMTACSKKRIEVKIDLLRIAQNKNDDVGKRIK